MYAGLDYGTSNCSIGLWRDGRARLVPLEDGRTLIPSTVYAPRQDLVLQAIDKTRYTLADRARLVAALRDRAERAEQAWRGQTLDLSSLAGDELLFGSAAMEAHFAAPEEGFYVKSPKSFLGARGLNEEVQERFVAIVGAMIANILDRAQQFAGDAVDRVVIGRPVNFQGAGGEEDNRRAVTMIGAAARDAGFTQVEFLFEPMAAAMEHEARLTRERLVLVVDIGGGTTDCSFVRIGPAHRDRLDRQADVLGHTGERLGGNDYDQLLAFHALMPALGLGTHLKNGLPVPNVVCMDAVSINDVTAQQRYYAAELRTRLKEYVQDAQQPEKLRRLLRLRDGRLTYRLVRAAELTKIALSDALECAVPLDFLEAGLKIDVERLQLEAACERLLLHLKSLVGDVLRLGGTRPDAVYLTGGMARSVLVRRALAEALPGIEIIDSDHFASVTEGLTLWAKRLFGAGGGQ